jgi:hypothetical protein
LKIVSYLKEGSKSYGVVVNGKIIDLKSRPGFGFSDIKDFIGSEPVSLQGG